MLGETKLNELIERLEAADEPDRGLDADIYCLLHPEWGWDRSTQQPTGWVSTVTGSGIMRPVPFFTASIDVAVTSIPPGWDVIEANSNGGLWGVRLGRGDIGNPAYREVWSWTGDSEREIFHRKPLALALCIVGLKATRHD